MFSFFNRWAERFNNKQIDAAGLVIFRVSFFLIFFLEVLHLLEFRHLLYVVVPYVQPADIDSTYLLVFWLVILGLLIFGAATRVAAIINDILMVHFMGPWDDAGTVQWSNRVFSTQLVNIEEIR